MWDWRERRELVETEGEMALMDKAVEDIGSGNYRIGASS